MSKGIKSLTDVRGLLDRIADQDRIIEELMELGRTSIEANDRLIKSFEVFAASDKRSEQLSEEALELAEEVADQYQRVVEKYLHRRRKSRAGADEQHKRAELLKQNFWKFYLQERPCCATKKEARRRAHERLIKKYPQYKKNGRIWADSYLPQVIRELERARIN